MEKQRKLKNNATKKKCKKRRQHEGNSKRNGKTKERCNAMARCRSDHCVGFSKASYVNIGSVGLGSVRSRTLGGSSLPPPASPSPISQMRKMHHT